MVFIIALFLNGSLLSAAALDGMVFPEKPKAGETWRQLLSRAYRDTPIKAEYALPLLILANRNTITGVVRLDEPVATKKTVHLPSASIIEDPKPFLDQLRKSLLLEFEKRLAVANFVELKSRFSFLHEILLPIFGQEAEIDRKQISFDYRVVDAFKGINDSLFMLRNHKPHSIELASQVRQSILAVEKEMAAAVSDPDLVVREELQKRLVRYRIRYGNYLEKEVIRRLHELSEHGQTKRVELGRQILHTLLNKVLLLAEGFFHPAAIDELKIYLARAHGTYIAPYTQERSLTFSRKFSKIVALLAPPPQKDNYGMGYKISDEQFASLYNSRSRLLRMDCSGFIGRVYRELARLSGMDLNKFVVSCTGAISSMAMIEKDCSKRVKLGNNANPLVNLRQGDFFYFEIKVRGKRDRHVCMFDRLLLNNPTKVSMWEASPGGVRQRVRSVRWIVKRITSPYCAPRGGAYRFNDMEKIARLLANKN